LAWLARLDARARRWPTPARWLYHAAKWYLVLGGAIILGLTYLERLGLGPF
jgi:hypothetical protein